MRYLMFAVFLLAPSAYAAPLEEASEGNYDLVAVELVYVPEQVVVGDGVVFVTHVANQGIDAIPPRTYRVDLYVDDERSWLGVWLIENEDGVGAIVRRVEDSSPAQEAGFEQGDILLTLADKSIASPSQVNFLLRRMKPGTEVSFGLVRNGVQMEKTVQLGTQPEFR